MPFAMGSGLMMNLMFLKVKISYDHMFLKFWYWKQNCKTSHKTKGRGATTNRLWWRKAGVPDVPAGKRCPERHFLMCRSWKVFSCGLAICVALVFNDLATRKAINVCTPIKWCLIFLEPTADSLNTLLTFCSKWLTWDEWCSDSSLCCWMHSHLI